MTMFETLCRAVRPDFDELYRDKAHYKSDPHRNAWTSDHGINGPFQSDIRDDVRLVLEAMEQSSPDVRRAMLESMHDAIALGDPRAREWYCGAGWKAGVRAILDEAG